MAQRPFDLGGPQRQGERHYHPCSGWDGDLESHVFPDVREADGHRLAWAQWGQQGDEVVDCTRELGERYHPFGVEDGRRVGAPSRVCIEVAEGVERAGRERSPGPWLIRYCSFGAAPAGSFARGLGISVIPFSSASTKIVSPFANLPRRSSSDSGSSIRWVMTLRSGRAP